MWRLQLTCRVYYEFAWKGTILSCMLASASVRSDLIMAWFITGNLRSDVRNTGEQYSSIVQAWRLRGSKHTRICLILVVLQSGTSYPGYNTCGQVIPILKLKTLEDRIIKQYPNSLNRMTFPSALYKSVQDGKRSLHVHGGRRDNRIAGRGIDTSVQITGFACNADGSKPQ